MKLITEDDHLEFENDADLSYQDDGEANIILHVKGSPVGLIQVFCDMGDAGREYIVLNNDVTYLDTLIKL
jgi:hypothetical protein